MCDSASPLFSGSGGGRFVQLLEKAQKVCIFDGCNGNAHSLGLCGKHYRAQWRARKNSLEKPQSRCRSCSGFFTPSKTGQQFCSHTCAARVRRGCKARDAIQKFVCAQCGGPFESSSVLPTIYCSKTCKFVAWKNTNPHRHRELQSIASGVRRARKRTATVEKVDPYKVFTRDKWRCQRCGVDTPSSKRGSYAADAPELDHIRPLSKGGAHSYKNTQCLCRRCNREKSDQWQPQEEENLLQA